MIRYPVICFEVVDALSRGKGSLTLVARPAPNPTAAYFILHVPKTGGITIAEHLVENCPRGVVWRPAPPTRFGHDCAPFPNFSRVRAVITGHYRGRSLERHFAGREIRRAVLLRDPVSLQISYYNWRMMLFLAQGSGTYSFPLHLRTLPRNFMLNFLLRYWLEIPVLRLAIMSDRDKFDMVQRQLSQFWFVGAHTDCARLIADLAPELDVPPIAAARNTGDEWRGIVDWQPLHADDLPPRLRSQILADHPLDQLLWETWHRAGFDVMSVRPAVPPQTRRLAAFAHDARRPALELVRLWRRGRARHPDIREIGLPPPPTMGPRGRTAPLSLAELEQRLLTAPTDLDLWRAYLTICRRTPPRSGVPAALIGSPSDIADGSLCLLKAETLVCCGQHAAARPFLRQAASFARNRRQERDITLRAAAFDDEFRAIVRQADRARDRGQWPDAARLYGAALAFHPSHCGYIMQYAHCLTALREYAIAELNYRSARALGAPRGDIEEPIRFVAAQQGYEEPTGHASRYRAPLSTDSLLEASPTAADIELAARIVTGAWPPDRKQTLELLRVADTLRDVFHRLIGGRHCGVGAEARSIAPEAAGIELMALRRARLNSVDGFVATERSNSNVTASRLPAIPSTHNEKIGRRDR